MEGTKLPLLTYLLTYLLTGLLAVATDAAREETTISA